MRVISWNVQGVKKQILKEVINLPTQTHKPDKFRLLETMVDEHNTNYITSKLELNYFDYTLLVNHCADV